MNRFGMVSVHQKLAVHGSPFRMVPYRGIFFASKTHGGANYINYYVKRIFDRVSGPRRTLYTLRDRIHMAFPKLSRRTMFTLGTKQDDGVALKAGTRIYEIHQKVRGMLSQGMVFHIGKALTLLSCFATDWAFIRSSLIASSMMSCTFHFLFPDPRPMRMFYGLLFACGHAFSLFRHMMMTSNMWEIRDKEKRALYDKYFREVGFTNYQFLQLLDECECKEVDFSDGAQVLEQDGDMKYIYIVMKGEVTFYRKMNREDMASNPSFSRDDFDQLASKEHKIGTVVSGGVVGELFDRNWNPEEEHKWRVSARCEKDTKLLQIEKRKLHNLAVKEELFGAACNRLVIKDLWRGRRSTALLVSKLESENEKLNEENNELRAALSKTIVTRVLD